MTQDETENPDEGRAPRRGSRVLRALLALVLVAGLSVLMLSNVSATAPYMAQLFAYIASPFKSDDNNLRLVAVYSDDNEESSFINGIRMAVAHINESKDKILGRSLDLELAEENGVSASTALETTVSRTLELSGSLARTKNLLAVIGHEWSDTAVTASSIYARNNVLFMATHATATSLTDHDFDTVFALQPDNATNANIVANYAIKQGMKRLIVLSDKTDYGKESANFFTEAITRAGAKLVYRGYLSSTRRSIDDLLMFVLDNKLFKRTDFDAFFIVSSSVPDTAEFIKRARYLGLKVPVLGMEYMFSEAIEKSVGKAGMKDVIGVSLYNRDTVSKEAEGFAAEYQKSFGSLPDLNAAIGYDAATLIRDAVNRAGTLDPARVSDILKIARYKKPFAGVTGSLVFDRAGLITDTHIFIVRHDGSEFRTVASIKIPLNRKPGSNGDPQEIEGPGDDMQSEVLPSEMETIGQ